MSSPALNPAESEKSAEIEATTPEPTANRSLRARVMTGGAWTTVGYGITQVVRLASNLLLARMLAPEAFGLMAFINTVLQGLQMFSDLGVGAALVQHKRGEEPNFANTAWVMQVIRGVGLGVICAIVSYPLSQIYDEPLLFQMLPVAGLSAVLAGLASPAIFLANRQLKLARLTLLEIGSHFISVVTMLVWAYFSPSVWALLIGTIVGVVVKTVGSHLFISNHRCQFIWDGQAARELFNFGRWIFISTALTFAASSIDRFLVPSLVTFKFLGFYSIALMLVRSLTQVISQVSGKVMFAALSEVYRESSERFDKVLRKTRLIVIGMLWSCALVLALIAVPLIDLLYPDEYAMVGTILGILAIGEITGAVGFSYGSALLAIGQSQRIVQILIPEIVIKLALILLGVYFGGAMGFVVGVAMSRFPIYFVEAYFLSKAGIWQKDIDIPAMLIGVALSGLLLMYSFGTFAPTP